MNSHVFLNGIDFDVFIMDETVDPNLIKVLPDFMNNLQQRRYQQPEMVPDVVKDCGMQYDFNQGEEWNPALHSPGCQCNACRERRALDHLAIRDLSYMQNCERKFVIDLKAYAFDTQSTVDYNRTMTLLRLHNSKLTPVLSNKYLVKILYTIISTDENNCLIATQDGAVMGESQRHYYMTNDQNAKGFYTYQFMDIHNSDVITIPTMYGAAGVTLNIRGIEVYGRTTGYALDIKPDGSLVYVNNGVCDVLLYKDVFGVEYRGYAYPVLPHDRVRVNFSIVFNNLTFISNTMEIKDTVRGLDYRTCDFDTVPTWNGIHLWSGNEISCHDIIHTADARHLQEKLCSRLEQIPIPNIA